MPLPLLISIPAILALVGYGAKKGFDAKEMNQQANAIAENAKKRHDKESARFCTKVRKTNQHLEEFGRLKVHVFSDQIKHLVEMLRKIRTAKSELADFNIAITDTELRKIDCAVQQSLELSSGLSKGTAAGVLAAVGAYGTVGTLASASTGTAIVSLSGVAASNATLAFLGGGSLAAGGGGIAAGTAVLGGIVLAPVIAISGFAMASAAEKSLTKAKQYEYDIDKSIAELSLAQTMLNGVNRNIAELTDVILYLASRYDLVRTNDLRKKKQVTLMLQIGKSLKICLDQAVMKKDGSPTKELRAKISGFREL